MVKENIPKEGIGSLSLILAIFAIMFSFTYISDNPIGKDILNTLRIPLPYEPVSFVLLIISFFIGTKYRHHFLATAGRNLSLCFLLIMIILTITSIVYG